jgi:DNA-binding beta-propeller fold protein YncE
MNRNRLILALALGLPWFLALTGATGVATVWMGKQPDGSYLVSSGQRIEGGSLSFRGRPVDLAMHPSGRYYAILNKNNILLGTTRSVHAAFPIPLFQTAAGYHGLAWSPDGKELYATAEAGHVQVFRYQGRALRPSRKLDLHYPGSPPGNPVPGGLAITKNGHRLFVVSANRNEVMEFQLPERNYLRSYSVGTLPFEPRLTEDESTLIVSNWGGRIPREGDRTAKSQYLDLVVDEKGLPASGTLSLIDLKTGQTRHVEVGLHPSGMVIAGRKVYVACASSDTVVEVDIDAAKVTRTIEMRWGDLRVKGGMPNALAIRNNRLYVADGGDNALAEVDLIEGKVKGFRPAGYFPIAVAIDATGKRALVLNTKGNGSVFNTNRGKPGNAHDFQGTVTVVDLTADLARDTAIVARNNHWNSWPGRPPLHVYNGGIKHVIYIIKENRTYDEVFGDLPGGNGDARLCLLGEKVMPNHRKIAQEFTLFDNSYVSGTNSADGHSWSTQCMANDYLEHFYVGYSRTYPDDGDDPMALSQNGALWDAAFKKGRSVRVYGEFCDEKLARIDPEPSDWFEVWEDRKNRTHRFKFTSDTHVAGLKRLVSRQYLYWPLLQSDQHRADIFLSDFEAFVRDGYLPDLMILSLPCDHGEGLNPKYPTPRAMMADNDLALGRIVEAVSRSSAWKETCIFVVEDDAQSGPDHVDGHRTVYLAVSPYTRRKFVDSTFYTQANMLRSIEMMLSLDPMNKFDAVAEPMTECFSDTFDATPYFAVPNNLPLDERNPSGRNVTQADRYWTEKTLALDWSHIDAPDPYWLNRINWYSIHKGRVPYPARPGEAPGQAEEDGDD